MAAVTRHVRQAQSRRAAHRPTDVGLASAGCYDMVHACISPSHFASSLSPTQYLCAKLPVHRLFGFCLHSTQLLLLHP